MMSRLQKRRWVNRLSTSATRSRTPSIYDDVGLRCRFGGELAGIQIIRARAAFLAGAVSRDISATIRQQSAHRGSRTEIEHACAGGNELGCELRARIGCRLRRPHLVLRI